MFCQTVRGLCYALIAVASLSCAKVPSSEVNFSSWFANYDVTTAGNEVKCTASFFVGNVNGTYIELDDSQEEVYCNGFRMQKLSSGIDQVYYEAKFYKANFVKADFELRRESGAKVYAYSTLLPQEILGVNIKNGQVFDSKKDLEIKWQSDSQSDLAATLSYKALDSDSAIRSTNYHSVDVGISVFTVEKMPIFSGEEQAIPAEIILQRSYFSNLSNSEIKGQMTKSTATSVRFYLLK